MTATPTIPIPIFTANKGTIKNAVIDIDTAIINEAKIFIFNGMRRSSRKLMIIGPK